MINKIGWFYLPTKSPNKNLSCVMQKLQQNRAILSAKIEHVLCLTILSADFLYIRQQIWFMLPWWLFTMEDEYLFKLFIVFLIYFRSFDAERSDASIILRSAICRCASWYRMT